MSAIPTKRIRVVQMHVVPGRPDINSETMLQAMAEARADGVAIAIFPEMAIPGYLLGDAWERLAFLRDCEAYGETIRDAAGDLIVVFGNVGMDWERTNEDGRPRKYNACFVAHQGRFIGREGSDLPFCAKTLMPNYREFDDSRYFFDLRKLAAESQQPLEELLTPVHVDGIRLGCMLCEDAWEADYAVSPFDILSRHGVDLLINISCSPFTLNKNHKRNRVFDQLAESHHVPMVYANCVGLQDNGKTVFTFDGSSCIYDGHGNQLTEAAPFEAGSITHDLALDPAPRFGTPIDGREDGIEMLYKAVRFGTQAFMQRLGVERVVVGVSGGIDSALVAALYSTFLPPENLLLVNMPSRFNSATTRGLAQSLAVNTGCLFAEVPIETSAQHTREQLHGLALRSGDGATVRELALSDFVMENVQARDRSSRVLAAIAAAVGGVFTCNANKSEATVGYTTLYGDLGGYLACIADLWKTEVFALARYMNDEVFGDERIPVGSIEIVPSAELSAAHNVDEGQGDPLVYPYHDRLFASWVEWWDRATPEEALEWYAQGSLEQRLGYEGNIAELFPDPATFIEDLERWWKLYQGMALAKRIQAPPVLAVKRRAFGFDHREAQLGPCWSRRYLELKEQLLR